MPIARPETWWVIVDLGHEPGYTDLRVFASTSVEDHLWMSWATHRPTQREIWRIVRGKRIYCGFKYIWDTPNVAEQTDPGDTLAHRFYISGIEAGSEVWYYLHAPNGPYGLEIQGPLTHVHLLTVPAWSTCAYFASHTKGMFRTADLSGPGGPQPTWIPDNAGLPFLDIRQACPDPWDPYHRRFVICHGDIYRMDNIFSDEPATATPVLTQAQAVYLTGGAPGHILWITGNANYPDHFYVVFKCDIGGTGTWCLKTIDAGETWTAHSVDPWWLTYDVGNIQAGTDQGESPYPPGDVLYIPYNSTAGGVPWVARSFDEGETWATTPTRPPGTGTWAPRLYLDPADQSSVYIGADDAGVNLYRTWNHGATWWLKDAGNALGLRMDPIALHAVMGSRRSDPDALRVLKDFHIWKSSDGGLIWRDQAATQHTVRVMHYKDHSPDFLYLARAQDAPFPDGLYATHVLFVSDDEGSNMFGKAGAHTDQDDGGGDSIPRSCGGAAHEGIICLPKP